MAKYEEEMDGLRVQVTDLKAKMVNLEAQIPIKDRQLQLLRDYIVAEDHQPETKQGPDDSAVTPRFFALRYDITNLTLDLFNGYPFHKPTKADHKAFFARLTATEKDYKEYLDAPNGLKAFFFEGVLWTKLIDRLLSTPLSASLDLNEGAIRDQVYRIVPTLVSTIVQCSDHYTLHSVLRCKSPEVSRLASLHGRLPRRRFWGSDAFGARTPWSPGGTARLAMVAELVDLLSRYSTSDADNVATLAQRLDDVVDKAVNLAWVMAKSRAYWVCSMPTCPQTKLPHGFVYQKEFIKVDKYLQGGRQNVVDLVGRPAMFKYGDSKGEQYDTCTVVEKAAALVFKKSTKDTDPDYMDT